MKLTFNDRILILLSLALLMVSGVSALDDFEVRYVMQKDNIEFGETAVAELQIFNYQDIKDHFEISSPDVDTNSWSVYTDPLSDYFIEVPANSVKTTKLLLKPLKNFENSYQMVRVKIESDTTKNAEQIVIPVQRAETQAPYTQYVPSVKASVNMPDEIDPRDTLPITINLENRNRRNLSNLIVKVDSTLFYKEIQLDLGPLDEAEQKFEVSFDPMQLPIKDTVHFYVVYEDATISEVQKPINVLSYTELDINRYDETGFLKKTYYYNITNIGNVLNDDVFEHRLKGISSMLSIAYPDAVKVKKGDESYLAWNLQLEPNQGVVLSVVVNYLYVVAFAFIVFLSLVLYFTLRSPIVIKKVASEVIKKEGGISKLKILIHIKNRSKSNLKDITIVERVPHLAKLIKESTLGSLEPYKIMEHDRKGTIIKWKMPSLEGFEERIITYKVSSRLTILGGFRMPPTIIRFMKKNREKVTSSKKLNIVY